MAYATPQDLLERFGAAEVAQLSGRTSGGVADTAMLARALADAQAEIDSHLAVRYLLPLATVPPLLVMLAADLARYHLWRQDASELVTERYKAAVATLKRLASGAMLLDGAAASQPAQVGAAVTLVAPARRRWGCGAGS